MRVLVTGGGGFTGSHVAEAALAEGLARTADWAGRAALGVET